MQRRYADRLQPHTLYLAAPSHQHARTHTSWRKPQLHNLFRAAFLVRWKAHGE